jgi:hypothetical protein
MFSGNYKCPKRLPLLGDFYIEVEFYLWKKSLQKKRNASETVSETDENLSEILSEMGENLSKTVCKIEEN